MQLKGPQDRLETLALPKLDAARMPEIPNGLFA